MRRRALALVSSSTVVFADSAFNADKDSLDQVEKDVDGIVALESDDEASDQAPMTPSVDESEESNSRLPSGIDPAGFLRNGYRPETWYWEFVTFTRKLCLILLIVLAAEKPLTQTIVACLVTMLAIILHLLFKPLPDTFQLLVELVSLSLAMIALQVSFLYFDDTFTSHHSYETTLTTVLILVNVVFLLSVIIMTLSRSGTLKRWSKRCSHALLFLPLHRCSSCCCCCRRCFAGQQPTWREALPEHGYQPLVDGADRRSSFSRQRDSRVSSGDNLALLGHNTPEL
jgi:hypothetical protein